MTDPSTPDPGTGIDWGMESIAWAASGEEMSRCTIESSGAEHGLLIEDTNARVMCSFSVERQTDASIQLNGALNGQSFVLPLTPSGEPERTDATVAIEPDAEPLLAQWIPMLQDVQGLLGILPDGPALEGHGKCAVAGFLGSVGCLATFSTLLVGEYYCDDILDTAYGWCSS